MIKMALTIIVAAGAVVAIKATAGPEVLNTGPAVMHSIPHESG